MRNVRWRGKCLSIDHKSRWKKKDKKKKKEKKTHQTKWKRSNVSFFNSNSAKATYRVVCDFCSLFKCIKYLCTRMYTFHVPTHAGNLYKLNMSPRSNVITAPISIFPEYDRGFNLHGISMTQFKGNSSPLHIELYRKIFLECLIGSADNIITNTHVHTYVCNTSRSGKNNKMSMMMNYSSSSSFSLGFLISTRLSGVNGTS